MRNLTVLFLLFASLFLGINHYITTTDNHNILQKVLGGFQVNAQEVTSCPVPIDIARLIKAANGNPFKTLRYTQKNGKVIWLEEGNSRSGWQHILERHYPDYPTSVGKGTPFPSVLASEIEDKIFDVVSTTDPILSSGNFKYEKIVNFSNGKSGTILVITDTNGKVITAYPPAKL